MTLSVVPSRLHAQKLMGPSHISPHDLVSHMLAMQSQDYAASLYAVGIRTGHTRVKVQQAMNEHTIVRTWPMRGTIHLVASEDVHWMLDLMSAKPLATAPKRMEFLGIDEQLIIRARSIVEKKLGHDLLTREQLYALFSSHKLQIEGQIGYHLIWRLCQEGVMGFMGDHGGQPTIGLLDNFVTPPKKLSKEEGLDRLVTRYFRSHGPATVDDLMFWSGMGKRDLLSALSDTASLVSEKMGDETFYFVESSSKKIHETHLLSSFDEYLLGYKRRDAVLTDKYRKIVASKNGIFRPIVVHEGHVIGIWKYDKKKSFITVAPFKKLSSAHRSGIESALMKSAHFYQQDIEVKYEKEFDG